MSFVSLSELITNTRAATVARRDGTPIPFARFQQDVATVTTHLKKYPRAALVCEDSYYFAVSVFAALYAGSIAVLPSNIQQDSLQAMETAYDILIDDQTLISFLQGKPTTLTNIDPMHAVLHFYSSGSTGVPKLIPKTFAALEAEVATLDQLWGETLGQGPIFATVPHQHLYGLIFKILWPLARGRAFETNMHSYWETLLPELTTEAILVTSPAHLKRLGGITPVAENQQPNRILSAGAPLTFEAATQCRDVLGKLPTEIFGSTETGAIATRSQTAQNQPWKPLPGIRIEADEQQRMVLHSPFVDGIWVAEDLIEPTPEGFHSLGRGDRIKKIEGKRVSLAEVEAALTNLPHIIAAAIVMKSTPKECLAAAIVLSAEGRAKLDEIGTFRLGRHLRQALTGQLEPTCLPHFWRFLDALPVNALGKQNESTLLALFGDEK